MAGFDVKSAESMLNAQTIGRKIIYQTVTGTTMDDALDGAKNKGQPHGTAYIAEVQTKARGSKGRQWNARNSGNLYLSFIIHRELKQVESNPKVLEYELDIAGALATLLAVEEEKVSGISIKWLNDVWIRGHKLCGALAEDKGIITVGSEQKHLLILGIGLNINCDIRRDSTMFGLATSTLCETGRELNREKIFSRICFHLEKILAMDREALYRIYTEKQTLQKGQKYKVTHLGPEGGSAVCKFLGVKEDWSIDLEDDSGEMFNASWSTVSVRPCPEQSVYILTGPHIEDWSCQLLTNTFRSLVDTTKLDMRSLVLKNGKEIPKDCGLIVIGQMKHSLDLAVANQIRDYVEQGGACICTGNSCSIFSNKENGGFEPGDPSRMILVPVKVSIQEGKTAESMLPTIASNSGLMKPESETVDVLASHSNSQGDKTSQDDSNDADIIVCNFGRGKVCLSTLNVEVTYADVDEVCPELCDRLQQLREGTFYRDSLILRMLHVLSRAF